jgi:hypothetical protein
MKKTILFLVALILVPMMAWANPFVTCDTYPLTEGVFELQYNTGELVSTQPLIVTGGSKVYYDLKFDPVGKHVVKARFKSLWGDVVMNALSKDRTFQVKERSLLDLRLQTRP